MSPFERTCSRCVRRYLASGRHQDFAASGDVISQNYAVFRAHSRRFGSAFSALGEADAIVSSFDFSKAGCVFPKAGVQFRPMLQHQKTLVINTSKKSILNVTDSIENVVRESGVHTGLCVVFVRHTSASLLVQENADPSVLADLERWMQHLAPESRHWEHDSEGPDDMPAHARCAVTRTSESIPITNGRLALGTWQGIYLWEHRNRSHQRQVVVHVMGG